MVHNAEGAVGKYKLDRGPIGGFTLVVDRSSSGLSNQVERVV